MLEYHLVGEAEKALAFHASPDLAATFGDALLVHPGELANGVRALMSLLEVEPGDSHVSGTALVAAVMGMWARDVMIRDELRALLHDTEGDRVPFSMRTTGAGSKFLKTLAETNGLSKYSVVEIAVREFARGRLRIGCPVLRW